MHANGSLLERDAELGKIEDAIASVASGTGTRLLIEGPAGIGKTSLVDQLQNRARRGGYRVLTARGTETERDFGFGVVRQLLGRTIETMAPDEREGLFAGSAALAATVFGVDDAEPLGDSAGEASLYGLYWLVAGLAEEGPVALVVDDAHWADSASLRFTHYLARRLTGVPLLLVLSARPNEPGAQAETMARLVAEIHPHSVHPSPLSDAGTAELVRRRLGGSASTAVEAACHEASGGVPLLIDELLTDLESSFGNGLPVVPEAVGTIGPARIARSVMTRSRKLDPQAPDLVRAAAVLGDGSELRDVSALAGVDQPRSAAIVDGLAAAAILAPGAPLRFAHPLLRTSVYEEISAATRSATHARAAGLLSGAGAEHEEVAAHLLLSEVGIEEALLDVLVQAAERAEAKGAPDSTAVYLRRALAEALPPAERGELLERLASAEVALRDQAAIAHLQEAAEIAEDPARALEITLQLADLLAQAGIWDPMVDVVDAGLTRFGATDLPGVLDLEAMRASYRGYHPALIADYDRDLPRLQRLVDGRSDAGASRLRWVMAAIGSLRTESREAVLELIGPAEQDWKVGREGRESLIIAQAAGALIALDAFEESQPLEAALLEDGRRRGSLMAMVAGRGYAAAANARRGRLRASESDLRIAIDLLRENSLGLMGLVTVLHFCIDTITERRALEDVSALAEAVVLPPAFARTFSGALLLEIQAAIRMARGDRAGAVKALREGERIFRPMGAGPRISAWRSRLALALPEAARDEALGLAREELEIARRLESRRAEGVALRACGLLLGNGEGVGLLTESVALLRGSPFELETARSLAALGGCLRRGNSRSEARERLREALEIAQAAGAERLEEEIVEEMKVAGARPRRREVSGWGSLTPAELRVATAAAGGALNREIAQELFVSLRTVEMHLTNAYRKLGIGSRGALAEAIAA